MYKRVCGDTYASRLSYRKLLEYLHTIEFTYILVMDSNRAEDGTDLRYRFAYEITIMVQWLLNIWMTDHVVYSK